jgi:hypothetical protein
MTKKSLRTLEEYAVGRQRSIAFNEERLPELIDALSYEREKFSLTSCLNSIASTHRDYASREFFICENLSAFKQHMHVCGLANLRSLQKIQYEKRVGFNAPRVIGFLENALLSDNIDLIRAIASIEQPDTDETRIIERMWKAALLGDDDLVKELLPQSAGRGTRKVYRKEVDEGRDFFSLLLARDQEGLNERIIKDVDIDAESMDVAFNDFVSLYSTSIAKLCHIRGILVEIDHPRVPMDLVRIAPLPHYDDVYDFLAPGYEPPPEGLFGHLKSWIKKK